MSLASRLDRLRGRGSEPAAGRPPGVAAGAPAAPVAGLAAAVGAVRHNAGLLLRERRVPLPELAPDLHRLPEVWQHTASDWLYLDTETTGLSGGIGNLAFMVGVARYTPGGDLLVRQYLIAGFADEAAMLGDLLDWVGGGAHLVSYNGKCFDLPLLSARCALHRLGEPLAQLPHLDLVFGVRRAFRRHWPDCRLQTAERCLLDLYRDDDLPGAMAPAAWQAWLRRGETTALNGVLRHNLQDVISLALLHRRLVATYAPNACPGVDHAAIGRAWQDAGRADIARAVWEKAGPRLSERGALQLAQLYRRQGHWGHAERVWRAWQRRGSRAAALELSKFHEHRRRDYACAIVFAEDCEPAERAARLARLRAKLAQTPQLALWPHGQVNAMK